MGGARSEDGLQPKTYAVRGSNVDVPLFFDPALSRALWSARTLYPRRDALMRLMGAGRKAG